MCRLIGIVGPLGHGKTTAAKMLVEMGYKRTRMADPLKDACVAMGMTRAQVDGDLKEVPADNLCGKTPRHAMQTLGNEWGRVMLGEDFWVRSMQKRLVDEWCQDPDAKIVIDDIRYPNEVEMVLGNGGEIWRVVDPRKLEARGSLWAGIKRWFGFNRVHASEYYWERIVPHADLDNSGSLEELHERMKMALDACTQRERAGNNGKTIRETTRAGLTDDVPAMHHILVKAFPL